MFSTRIGYLTLLDGIPVMELTGCLKYILLILLFPFITVIFPLFGRRIISLTKPTRDFLFYWIYLFYIGCVLYVLNVLR